MMESRTLVQQSHLWPKNMTYGCTRVAARAEDHWATLSKTLWISGLQYSFAAPHIPRSLETAPKNVRSISVVEVPMGTMHHLTEHGQVKPQQDVPYFQTTSRHPSLR
ncbi:hypothetical protein BC628DRAFT_82968 [Trametes gibbosa]|nr:hypothetical protein BC628DRAFT_82968 [Trametes gibbosa]